MLTISVPAAPAKVHFRNVLRDWRHSSSSGSFAISLQSSGCVINELANPRLNLCDIVSLRPALLSFDARGIGEQG